MTNKSIPTPSPQSARTINTVAEYVGVTALASAALLVGGVFSSGAYLAAWNVPIWVVKLDPLTAALRAETVLYTAALLLAAAGGYAWFRRRLTGMRRGAMTDVAAAGFALLALATLALVGFVGPGIAIASGVVIAMLRLRGGIGDWLALALSVIALTISAHQTGMSSGVLVRDNAAWQTPIAITTQLPVAGLPGAIADGDGWRYEDLYLVFRDDHAVLVGKPGAGSVAWIVTDLNLRAIQVGQR